MRRIIKSIVIWTVIISASIIAYNAQSSAVELAVKPVVTSGSCDIVYLADNEKFSSTILIVDEKGIPHLNAREVVIKIDTRGTTVAKCLMYAGLYAPSNPEIKNWTVRKIRSVDIVEFQKIIDGQQPFTAPEDKVDKVEDKKPNNPLFTPNK